jgi:membrane-bound ClpP family serine protease
MGWWLAFAVLLYFVCSVLLVAEVFMPSGGLLSICAFGCLMGGTAIFFKHSTIAGLIGIVVAIVMIPSVLFITYSLAKPEKKE